MTAPYFRMSAMDYTSCACNSGQTRHVCRPDAGTSVSATSGQESAEGGSGVWTKVLALPRLGHVGPPSYHPDDSHPQACTSWKGSPGKAQGCGLMPTALDVRVRFCTYMCEPLEKVMQNTRRNQQTVWSLHK